MSELFDRVRSTYRSLVPEPARRAIRRVRDLEKDLRGTAVFLADVPTRRRQLEEMERCTTIDQHFDFAVARLGPHQRKEEIVAFLERAERIEPRCVCEIGTANGGTNMMLGRALGTAELVLGIDLRVRNKAKLRYFASPSQRRDYLDASSRAPSSVAWVERKLAGRPLDVLFVDGDHSYSGAKSDFLAYRHLVREGGLIAFHDIVADHGARFGKKTMSWSGGVPDLWKELRAFYPCEELVKDPEQDGCGIGVVTYARDVQLPASFTRLDPSR